MENDKKEPLNKDIDDNSNEDVYREEDVHGITDGEAERRLDNLYSQNENIYHNQNPNQREDGQKYKDEYSGGDKNKTYFHEYSNEVKRNKHYFIVIIVLLLCLALTLYLPLLSRENKSTAIKTTTTQESNTNVSSGKTVVTDVSSVIEEIKPALVSVTTVTEYQNPYAQFFGEAGTYTSQGAGSGVIIGKTETELLIVTNNHVIADTNKIQVTFADEESVNAKIKSIDTNVDIALLSVSLDSLKDSTVKNIKVITIGDSDNLKVGEGVIAAGNALGYGLTITTGVVSATDREIVSDTNNKNTYIQTDAAINPGNSGGALLNSAGELIGINVAKYSDTEIEGIGFAIPISSISSILDSMSKEEVKEEVSDKDKGYLGIAVSDVDSQISELYGVPQGARVETVSTKNAEKSGIKEGDIITKFEGKTINNRNELTNYLKYYKKGETVILTVQRMENNSYKEKEIKITLSSSSDMQQAEFESQIRTY